MKAEGQDITVWRSCASFGCTLLTYHDINVSLYHLLFVCFGICSCYPWTCGGEWCYLLLLLQWRAPASDSPSLPNNTPQWRRSIGSRQNECTSPAQYIVSMRDGNRIMNSLSRQCVWFSCHLPASLGGETGFKIMTDWIIFVYHVIKGGDIFIH